MFGTAIEFPVWFFDHVYALNRHARLALVNNEGLEIGLLLVYYFSIISKGTAMYCHVSSV